MMVDELATRFGSTWKEAPDFPGYWVSMDGRVYSRRTDSILKPGRGSQLTLRRDGEAYSTNVAGLVYSAFVGPVPTDKRVWYKDGNHRNYDVNNLYLINRNDKNSTPPPESLEKKKDTLAVKYGIVKAYGPCGEYYEARTIREMVEMIGGVVGRTSIGDCCSGKRASAKGWQFERVKSDDCAW